MNSHPHGTHGGRPIDPDLGAVQSAWSELEQCEPPDLLDQAVLNAARRQLERSRRRRSMGWLGAFATAATWLYIYGDMWIWNAGTGEYILLTPPGA